MNAVCAADVPCVEATRGWELLHSTWTQSVEALSCSTNDDCTIVHLSSLCKLDCGTALNTATAPVVSQELDSYAMTNCAACPQSGAACPPVVFTAECNEGLCRRVP